MCIRDSWYPTYVASYVGGKWHYSLLTIRGNTYDLEIFGQSCVDGTCWITGTAYTRSDEFTGFVLPFPTIVGDAQESPIPSTSTTVASPVNLAIASCQADARSVETAVAAWLAQSTGSPPTSSTAWRRALIPNYLTPWPEGQEYSISVAGDRALIDSGDNAVSYTHLTLPTILR